MVDEEKFTNAQVCVGEIHNNAPNWDHISEVANTLLSSTVENLK